VRLPNEYDDAIRYMTAVKTREHLNKERKIRKLQALMNDSASTEGEKESCKQAIQRLSN
jgi:hypothetical protein